MKLLPMIDFVLEQQHENPLKFGDYPDMIRCIFKYAKFLKQPLKLEMFVNPIPEPELQGDEFNAGYDENWVVEYQEAQEKVLFEGWVYISEWYGGHLIAKNKEGDYQFCTNNYNNIEDLLSDVPLKLTPSAIKQFS